MKRVYVIIMVWIAMAMVIDRQCLAAEGAVAEKAAGQPSSSDENADETVQLRVYRGALFEGPKDENRLDSATVLLRRKGDAAEEILLEALQSHSSNPGACNAVLKVIGSALEKGQAPEQFEKFIEPVFAAMSEGDNETGWLAAETLSLFPYSQAGSKLRGVAKETAADQKLRLRAIRGLGNTVEERESLLCLIDLLGSVDGAVAAEAAKSLPFWVTADGDVSRIRQQLQKKDPEEIVRERIVVLEQAMSKIKAEAQRWKDLYMQRLEKEYEQLDDKGKGQLVYDELGSDFEEIRLWAMEKLEQRSATVVLPEQIGEQLVRLVSDENSSVRLKAAQVLAKMGDRNPGPGLLKQLRVEKDDSVRLAILEALGEACYFAFSPGSPVQLDPAVRLATLDEAAESLLSEKGHKARTGAAVIRKVLEPNGLDDEAKEKYLGLIAERFAREQENSELKTMLIEVMANLAEQSSTRAKAAKLFKKSFLYGLEAEENAAVRAASVKGLIALDKAMAMEEFRSRQVMRDPDGNVRAAVVRLAGEVGGEADLEWLVGGLGSEMEGEAVWQSMQSILLRQKSDVLVNWAGKLEAAGASEDQIRYLLEMAAKKAEGENNKAVRTRARDMLLSRKLGESLASGDFAAAAELISARLEESGVVDGGAVSASVEVYLAGGADGAIKQQLVEALGQIDAGEARPEWESMLGEWRKRLASEQKVARQIPGEDVPGGGNEDAEPKPEHEGQSGDPQT